MGNLAPEEKYLLDKNGMSRGAFFQLFCDFSELNTVLWGYLCVK